MSCILLGSTICRRFLWGSRPGRVLFGSEKCSLLQREREKVSGFRLLMIYSLLCPTSFLAVHLLEWLDLPPALLRGGSRVQGHSCAILHTLFYYSKQVLMELPHQSASASCFGEWQRVGFVWGLQPQTCSLQRLTCILFLITLDIRQPCLIHWNSRLQKSSFYRPHLPKISLYFWVSLSLLFWNGFQEKEGTEIFSFHHLKTRRLPWTQLYFGKCFLIWD